MKRQTSHPRRRAACKPNCSSLPILALLSAFAVPAVALDTASLDDRSVPSTYARTSRPMDPPGILKHTTDRLLSAIDDHRNAISRDFEVVYHLVDEYASPHIDYDLISKRILGKHWRRASETQRARFKREFRVLLVRSYVTAISNYSFRPIVYLPSTVSADGQEVTVRTRVPQRNGNTVSVHYHMHHRGEAWQVFDVAIEGRSLVMSYRSEFSGEIRRRGLEGLIEELADRNARSRAG